MSNVQSEKFSAPAEVKEYVLRLLKDYRNTDRQIQLLRYEMEHCSVSAKDVISEMAFARGDGSGRSPSQISNKTLYIALNYQEKAEKYRAETTEEIACRLWELERERDRLTHFVSLLDEKQAAVIRLCYFEGKSRDEIAAALSIGVRSVQRFRNLAITALCEMYHFIADLK